MSAAHKIQPGWFSITGAAIYTGFTAQSIRNAIAAGHLHPRKVKVSGESKVSRIKRDDLDAWCEGEEQSAANPQPAAP